jgi:hypothetical protein
MIGGPEIFFEPHNIHGSNRQKGLDVSTKTNSKRHKGMGLSARTFNYFILTAKALFEYCIATMQASGVRSLAPLLKRPPFAILASYFDLPESIKSLTSFTADSLLDVVAVFSTSLSPAFADS